MQMEGLANAPEQDIPRLRRTMAAMYCMSEIAFGNSRSPQWLALMRMMGSKVILTVPEIHAELGVLHALLVQQGADAIRAAQGGFSATYDKWTSTTLEFDIYALVASFVDSEWTPCKVVLDFRIVEKREEEGEAASAAWVIGVLERTGLLDKWSGILTTDSSFDNVRTAQILEKHFGGSGAESGASFTLANGLVLSVPRQLELAVQAGFAALGKAVVPRRKHLQTDITEDKIAFQDCLPKPVGEELRWRYEILALVDEAAAAKLANIKQKPVDAEAQADKERTKTLLPIAKELAEQPLVAGMEPPPVEEEPELEPVASMLDTVNDMIKHITINPKRRGQFEAASTKLFGRKKAPPLPPIDKSSEEDAGDDDDEWGWGSVEWSVPYAQIRALIKARPVLAHLIETEPRLYKRFEVPEAQWKALERFAAALRFIERTSKDEEQTTLGNLLKLYADVNKILCTEKLEDEPIRKALQAMQGAMQPCAERALSSRPVVLAALLDPRYRLSFFTKNHLEHVERVKGVLREAVVDLCGEEALASLAVPAGDAKDEIEAFFSDTYPLLETEDGLTWWERNAPSLPNLAQLARICLAADGSTIATDEAFAKAGEVCGTAGSVGFAALRKVVMARMLSEAGYDVNADLPPEAEQDEGPGQQEDESEEDDSDEDEDDSEEEEDSE